MGNKEQDTQEDMNSVESIGSNCCGCGNCYQTCPKNAIEMLSNAEGFLTPVINDKCVNCGACLNVCPQNKEINFSSEKKIGYVAISRDREILRNSASGGIFGTIAKHYLSQSNTYICAASFDSGDVRHIITQNLEDIKKCQGSKYVQSNLSDCFPNIKVILRENKNRVLFCGTPCQVAALYSYLKSRPANLLTLDLVCHGVPSPKFLKKDIEHYCKDMNELENLKFRWKHPDKPRGGSGFFLALYNTSKYRLYSSSYDPYFASFMRGESFRESCYQCRYANLNRVGDITIGDCDSAKLYPHFHPDECKSSVIVNTSIGNAVWEDVKNLFDYDVLDLMKEAEANHQLSHPFVRPKSRDCIYKDVEVTSFNQMKKKYASPNTKQQKVLSLIQTYIPILYKLIILKMAK